MFAMLQNNMCCNAPYNMMRVPDRPCSTSISSLLQVRHCDVAMLQKRGRASVVGPHSSLMQVLLVGEMESWGMDWFG
jgi:hypothetical protein